MSDDQSSEPRVAKSVKPLRVQRVVDEAYRAIGHYVVAFASLISEMRRAVVAEIADYDDPRFDYAHLATGGLEAQSVADAFFAICRLRGDLDETDTAVERVLREQHVNQTIRRRNQIAHGSWLIQQWFDVKGASREEIDSLSSRATLMRIKASDTREPFKSEDVEATDIENEAKDIEALAEMVGAFCCICTDHEDRAGAQVQDALMVLGPANSRRVAWRPGYQLPESWRHYN